MQTITKIKLRGSFKKCVDFCHNFLSKSNVTSKIGSHNQTINHFNYSEENSNLIRYFKKYFKISKPKNEFMAHGKILLFTKLQHRMLIVKSQKWH